MKQTTALDRRGLAGTHLAAVVIWLLPACGDRGDINLGDPAAADIVLIAGGPSHGPGEHEYFAGAVVVKALVEQTPGVSPAIVRDTEPYEAVLAGKRAAVFITDGNHRHPLSGDGRMELLEPHISSGIGLVAIHWSVHLPARQQTRNLQWLGGFYQDGISVNPIWTAEFSDFPDHPISRGVAPFELRDEWYYNMVFADTGGDTGDRLTPILQAIPPDSTRSNDATRMHPGRAEITAWAIERSDGGRSFAITGAHYHKSYRDPNFRRVVVNGILWAAGYDVPAPGAPVALDPDDLKKNWDGWF